MKRSALASRIARLVEKAGGQRALSRALGVADGTVIGWLGGAEPYERTLAQIAERTGVSVAWLRDGQGNEEEELGRFSRQIRESSLSTESDESSRVREDPATPAMLPAPANCHRIIEHLTHGMSPERITTALSDVMNDQQLSPEERRRTGQALTQILSARLSRAAEHQTRKN